MDCYLHIKLNYIILAVEAELLLKDILSVYNGNRIDR